MSLFGRMTYKWLNFKKKMVVCIIKVSHLSICEIFFFFLNMFFFLKKIILIWLMIFVHTLCVDTHI
jgi:hypothetical protein